MIQRLKLVPADEIFQLNTEFNQNKRREKINGGIGVYLDSRGNPYVHPVVKKAIKFLTVSNFNYLPIAGDPSFLKESTKLLLGDSLFSLFEEKLAKQGVSGGTNGLFIWGSLIKETEKKPVPPVINTLFPRRFSQRSLV